MTNTTTKTKTQMKCLKNPTYAIFLKSWWLSPIMMIDTSPRSSCSRQSPWLPFSSHKISSTGPSVSLFRDFLCILYFFICVFVFFFICVFTFCVVYLCICTYLCIRIRISVCVSVHLCICICATTFVWSVYVSLYLCVLSWWAEDRSSFSTVRPSLQPALGFSNSLRWRQKANTISETMYWFMKILDSLSSEGLEKIEFNSIAFLDCESKSEFLLN